MQTKLTVPIRIKVGTRKIIRLRTKKKRFNKNFGIEPEKFAIVKNARYPSNNLLKQTALVPINNVAISNARLTTNSVSYI